MEDGAECHSERVLRARRGVFPSPSRDTWRRLGERPQDPSGRKRHTRLNLRLCYRLGMNELARLDLDVMI